MAVLEKLLGSKKRLFFMLVCGYVLVVLLWQLQSSSISSLISSHAEQTHQEVFVMTHNVSHTHGMPLLDIHIEDPSLGHTGEILGQHLHNMIPASEKNRTIAIGGGITSAKIKALSIANVGSKFPLFKHLLPSFCKTATPGYHYHFYLGYDQNDAFLAKVGNAKAFQDAFYRCLKDKCSQALHEKTHIHLVQCSHSKKPAWAQNDAMMEAYIDGIEYYYRLNDDTEMETSQWLEAFIKILKGYDPPLVGVVGPKHKGGNEAILTYDFVHKTHVDIFGFYYPRLFSDWWADDWMTQVYKPGRSTKMANVRLKHTMELGQRYITTKSVGPKVKGQIEGDKKTLVRYLKHREQKGPGVLPDGHKVISMTLYGKDPKYSLGVMRNAQLLPVVLPGWTLRVYATDPSSTTADLLIPSRILHRLSSLGVQLAFVDPSKVTLPPSMWNMLVADDPDVDHFLVRDATHRVSDREAAAVNFWLQTDRPFFTIKDHPSHAEVALVKGLWGARPTDLLRVLGDPIYLTLQKSLAAEETQRGQSVVPKPGEPLGHSAQDILVKHIWPLVQSCTLVLDSVSCDKSTASFPFPVKRLTKEYVGQGYDEHQLPLVPVTDISSPQACTSVDLKPSDVPPLPELPTLKPVSPKANVSDSQITSTLRPPGNKTGNHSSMTPPPLNGTASSQLQNRTGSVNSAGPGVNTTDIPQHTVTEEASAVSRKLSAANRMMQQIHRRISTKVLTSTKVRNRFH